MDRQIESDEKITLECRSCRRKVDVSNLSQDQDRKCRYCSGQLSNPIPAKLAYQRHRLKMVEIDECEVIGESRKSWEVNRFGSKIWISKAYSIGIGGRKIELGETMTILIPDWLEKEIFK